MKTMDYPQVTRINPGKCLVQPKALMGVKSNQFNLLQFGSKIDGPSKSDPVPTAQPKKLTTTLFGSPLKNIGWSALFVVAGIATFIVPPVAISLLFVSGVFLTVALLQALFHSTEKKNEYTMPNQQELTKLKESISAAKSPKAQPAKQVYARPVTEFEEDLLLSLMRDLGSDNTLVENDARKALFNLGVSQEKINQLSQALKMDKLKG